MSSIISSYRRRGCPPGKLNVGVPFYGRGFKGVPPGPNAQLPGYMQGFSAAQTAASDQSVTMPTHRQVVALGYPTYYDSAAQASFAYSAAAATWITFDNEAAVAAKAAFVRQQGLRGAMVWALGQDADARLWTALANALRG